jgi:5-methylcytosine-specific restriction endonuclease McrA
MIHREFKPPNFLCEVSDPAVDPNRIDQRLERADSEAELRQKLQGKGLAVHRIDSYEFSEWQRRAAAETARAVQARTAGTPYEFKSALWTELKDYLFRLFDGKCAYCEAVVQDVASGDVEHYRPKKKVEEDPAHPGYYWLAYDPQNLFPCCEKCNRARAKMNHFPIQGQRAVSPSDDLAQEKPLLLNPYTEVPPKHLQFIPNNNGTFPGTVAGTTPEGQASVQFYNLRREALREARARAQSGTQQRLEWAAGRGQLPAVFHELGLGHCEFSAACLAIAARWWAKQKAEVENELKGIGGNP